MEKVLQIILSNSTDATAQPDAIKACHKELKRLQDQLEEVEMSLADRPNCCVLGAVSREV